MLYKNKSTISAKPNQGILRELDFVDQKKGQRLKSSEKGDENILIFSKPTNSTQKKPVEAPKQEVKKMQALEPGKLISPFEEVLSTTETVDNGTTTYLISKALSGPML